MIQVVKSKQLLQCLAKDIKERHCLEGNPRTTVLVVVIFRYFAIFQFYFSILIAFVVINRRLRIPRHAHALKGVCQVPGTNWRLAVPRRAHALKGTLLDIVKT